MEPSVANLRARLSSEGLSHQKERPTDEEIEHRSLWVNPRNIVILGPLTSRLPKKLSELSLTNVERIEITITNGDGVLKMTGTAVSGGVIKARICVAEDLVDADQIQPGDILITYSTDIGWSPYFPIISGLVTEIGGTISHGSVIAREFG